MNPYEWVLFISSRVSLGNAVHYMMHRFLLALRLVPKYTLLEAFAGTMLYYMRLQTDL
jgi:hypothetical protein